MVQTILSNIHCVVTLQINRLAPCQSRRAVTMNLMYSAFIWLILIHPGFADYEKTVDVSAGFVDLDESGVVEASDADNTEFSIDDTNIESDYDDTDNSSSLSHQEQRPTKFKVVWEWDDGGYVMSTIFMVITMQTGFALLESGCVSQKSEVLYYGPIRRTEQIYIFSSR